VLLEVFDPSGRPGSDGFQQFKLGALQVPADVRPASEENFHALENAADRTAGIFFPALFFTHAFLR
jgi:hypothetical protein